MKIACAQSHVVFGNPLANAQNAVRELERLKALDVDLVVFPEAYLTGYCVSSSEEACAVAISSDSEAICLLRDACDSLDILAVVGYAEAKDGSVFNAAALFEPGTSPRIYRKTHLPDLGLDKFVKAGEEIPVFETRLGKLGVLICFDLRPPEATRVLALNGAEILILPTNWPVGAEVSAAHIAIARAAENRIFVATCNRVGEEHGFRFIGQSKIINVVGKVLAAADTEAETIIAEIDLADARQKRTVGIPGKYETEVFASRNPSLYSRITAS